MADPRFASLKSDPRFLKPKKVAQKVQVDERFANLLNKQDSKKKKQVVDKRGRRKDDSNERKDLEKFYKLDQDVNDEEDKGKGKKKEKESGMSAGEKALKMARGELIEESSDESEQDEEDEDDEDSEEDGADSALTADDSDGGGSEFSIDLDEDAAEPALPDELADAEEDDGEGVEQEITTNRMALLNMDWDHIRAVDLFKVLQSALQHVYPQGSVQRVSIYLSEFGKERMKREELEGPPKELFASASGQQDEDDEDKLAQMDEEDVDERMITQEQEDAGEEINSKALRRYQLERLRYCYAVAEFDAVKSARAAFMEVQGTEYERSANTFELRCAPFLSYVLLVLAETGCRAIPEDMSFDDDEPRDVAKSSDDLSNYEGGLDYVTTALRHSKVKLTWDQDDPKRSRVTRLDPTKMTKDSVDQIDYKDFIASGSSDEEESDNEQGEDRAAKFRALMGLGAAKSKASSSKADKGPSGGMEITFKPALEDNNDDDDQTSSSGGEETTIEKYKRKEKERKDKKRAAKIAARQQEGDEEQGIEEDDFFQGFEDEDAAFAAALEEHDNPTAGKPSTKKGKAPKQHAEQEEDGEGEGEGEGKKGTSRSARRKKGARAAKKEKEAAAAADQDNFVLDTKDERFKNVHEDPAFAIDPSNPR